MLVRLPSLTHLRLWALLLLAVIGLQATVPPPASPHRTSGSAFSATTQEVALAVQRTERVQRQAVAPQPALPQAVRAQVLPAPVAALTRPVMPRPESTGPPPAEPLAWRPAPRAPPRA